MEGRVNPEATTRIPEDDPFLHTRMSFGDHLEELRSCLIRALLGLVLAVAVSFLYAQQIVVLLYRPLYHVQKRSGVPAELMALSPSGPFLVYMKIAMLAGLILAMPWVLYQLWRFVSVGLYPKERKFAKSLMPATLGLFTAGVLFVYFVVLPLVLRFFLIFNSAFKLPGDDAATTTQVATAQTNSNSESLIEQGTRITVLEDNPPQAKPGDVWIHEPSGELRVQTAEDVLSIPMQPVARRSAVRSQFALDSYVAFVLLFALAFGLAFELPVVVFFLAWSGIVSAKVMGQGRRYVIMAIVVIAAILTPPDAISQLLLAVPMYALFEAGLWIARITERRRANPLQA